MEMVYLPGSSFVAGKLYSPFSFVTTEMVLVDPSILALTTTPSMTGSCVDVTFPLSATAVCACTGRSICNSKAARLIPTSSQALLEFIATPWILLGFDLLSYPHIPMRDQCSIPASRD